LFYFSTLAVTDPVTTSTIALSATKVLFDKVELATAMVMLFARVDTWELFTDTLISRLLMAPIVLII